MQEKRSGGPKPNVGNGSKVYSRRLASRESYALFQCGCDGGAQPKFIDPFGYHVVHCKDGANAIRLHDEVVLLLAKFTSSLRLPNRLKLTLL